VIPPMRRGPRPHASRRCGATSPSRGRSAYEWRFARTHPVVKPPSARSFNASRSESSRVWCEGGDTPWFQESALSLSTLLE
jgi:hypothetical protein